MKSHNEPAAENPYRLTQQRPRVADRVNSVKLMLAIAQQISRKVRLPDDHLLFRVVFRMTDHISVLVASRPGTTRWLNSRFIWCPRIDIISSLSPEARLQSYLADRLIRELCKERNAPLHSYSAGGRPVTTGFSLSASHDGVWTVAAISKSYVGIDVVNCERSVQWIRDLLTSEELIQTAGVPSESDLGAAWAIREASLKRARRCLTSDPRKLLVFPLAKEHHANSTLLFDGRQVACGTQWRCESSKSFDDVNSDVITIMLDHHHVMAIAFECPAHISVSKFPQN